MPLLEYTKKGLYCSIADVFIDPSSKADKVIITHAHADHAKFGSKLYIAHSNSVFILKHKFGNNSSFKAVEYGETFSMNGVNFSLHPAGHIIGSAQVRIEYKGEVWVVSGDYKLENDGISGEFEPLKCNVFITESTFALPVFKWKTQSEVFSDINSWWRNNRDAGVPSVLLCYSLGKAQRILCHIDRNIGPVYTHSLTSAVCETFRRNGVSLPDAPDIPACPGGLPKDINRSLILAPSSVRRSGWLEMFESFSLGCASGWMMNGNRRHYTDSGLDAGFALSDHADWEGLNTVVAATGAEKVFVHHGYSGIFARALMNDGINARELKKPNSRQGELF